MASTPTLFLSSTHREAAGTLFAIALHQAQLHQTRPLGLALEDEPSKKKRNSCRGSTASGDSFSEDREPWARETCGLLRPVLKFIDVDSASWPGIEEAAGSSPTKSHVSALLRLLSEESDDTSSSQSSDQLIALVKAVDVMEQTMEPSVESSESKKKKHQEYEQECRENLSTTEVQSSSSEKIETAANKDNNHFGVNDASRHSANTVDKELVEEERMVSYQKKITVLYELLSACLADRHDDKMKSTRKRKGYDARHRVALRLLATWLDIEWRKMEAIETMVACTAMAIAKEEESKQEESGSPTSRWAKWKRGGIIGAAAITGGTLLAVTGAAPAIAAGIHALAPTLGTIIPVIGASGFAAAASAAGTVAGSVAVAASFGAAGAGLAGTKMARRTGSVDEFEFKTMGENHQQGRLAVEIVVSGCVFNEEDFVRPWEGYDDKMERYALQWESKVLFAMSTAIQDWLASNIATELMKQGAMLTVLSTLAAALAWPATLLQATGYIDGKWTIAIDRSDKAGKLLAEVLLKGLQGNRPVTLVGYSLGARAIFKCLQTLAETEHNAELVERVVLLGAPISIRGENWEAARKMVAGRFVNAYSTSDWTLGVAFRASLLTQGLAGIQPVGVPGIENVNVTSLIEGHSSYLWATKQILERLELDTYYPVFRSTVI